MPRKLGFPSDAHARLYRAIRRFLDIDQLRDVARGGADAGWSGFTYTSDCVPFYQRHEQDIWELLNEAAEAQGVKPMELVAGFARSDMAESPEGLKNLLAWFALEEIARMVDDQLSQEG